MKTVPIHQTHSVTNAQDTIALGLDPRAAAHFMHTLSNLYSDPILAVVREYSTNARDSHLEAGVDRPIEVTLPTADNPYFTVRDYGVGLSLDEIRNVYALYGASTKRDSDLVTGTLGFGCKSGLTYAPLGFTVTAVKGGVKVVAVIAKTDEGGTIQILDTSATDEPNGVAIKIPVERGDFDAFSKKVENIFHVWQPGTVLVDGEVPRTVWDHDDIAWVDEDVALVRTGASTIVMGGVPYEVDRLSKWGLGVVAFVPMGSVHFTPSREALHFTDHTEETLATLFEFVDHHAERHILDFIETADTAWEKRKRYSRWQGTVPYEMRRRLHAHFRITLDEKIAAGRSAYRYDRNRYRNTVSVSEGYVPYSWVRNESALVVTDYPNDPRTLSATVKERLGRYENANSWEFIILPDGSDLSWLDGRPNVVSWPDLVEATKLERAPRGSGEKKTTAYQWWKGEGTFFDSADCPDDSLPIIVNVQAPRDRWGYRGSADTAYLSRRNFPNAWTVEIQKRQVDKFLRLFPAAKMYSEVLTAKQAEIAASLTPVDSLLQACRLNRLYWVGTALLNRQAEVLDPDLVTTMNLMANPPQDSVARLDLAAKFDVQVPVDETFDEIVDRYPLLTGSNGYGYEAVDDLILYLNAKYQSITNTNDNENPEEGQAA